MFVRVASSWDSPVVGSPVVVVVVAAGAGARIGREVSPYAASLAPNVRHPDVRERVIGEKLSLIRRVQLHLAMRLARGPEHVIAVKRAARGGSC